jgi:hypothetical protein
MSILSVPGTLERKEKEKDKITQAVKTTPHIN